MCCSFHIGTQEPPALLKEKRKVIGLLLVTQELKGQAVALLSIGIGVKTIYIQKHMCRYIVNYKLRL